MSALWHMFAVMWQMRCHMAKANFRDWSIKFEYFRSHQVCEGATSESLC